MDEPDGAICAMSAVRVPSLFSSVGFGCLDGSQEGLDFVDKLVVFFFLLITVTTVSAVTVSVMDTGSHQL